MKRLFSYCAKCAINSKDIYINKCCESTVGRIVFTLAIVTVLFSGTLIY